MAKTRAAGGGFGPVLLGFLLGVLATAGAGVAYYKITGLKVATVNEPLSLSKRPAGPPLNPRPDRENIPPFGASEDAFEAGAHIYKAHCAGCHGTPGHNAAFAKSMNPAAAQIWNSRGKQASGRETTKIYSNVANGIRLTGMPAYKHVLSATQMWQVSLLLANANKELPNPVTRILTGP